MEYIVGVDKGETATDCVIIDEKGKLTISKAFSMPPDFTEGVMTAIQIAAEELGTKSPVLLENTRLFLHSSTVAENAIVDGKLAKGGLLITRGFEETLFMMRCGYGRWAGRTDDEKKNPIEVR
jgi:N-methylhydantoinase A